MFSFLICGLALCLIHRCRAVAGRLLKRYQEVTHDISLCLFTFGHCFPVPKLVLVWPSFFFLMLLHLCLIYVCIIILCVGPWTALGSHTGRMFSITVTF